MTIIIVIAIIISATAGAGACVRRFALRAHRVVQRSLASQIIRNNFNSVHLFGH